MSDTYEFDNDQDDAGEPATGTLPLDAWHTLELQVVDRKVTGLVNGSLRVEHALDQPVSGRVGLWAKPDSVSAFKGLRIQK